MKLQQKLSNGMWTEIEPNRNEEFLDAAVEFETRMARRLNTPVKTKSGYIQLLKSGKRLSWDEDWYAEIRDADAVKSIVPKPVELVKCACGHAVSKSSVMSASMGSSCPECYDRMSE